MAAIGEDHQATVAVQVDEPGRDDLAGGVDRASDVLGAGRLPARGRAAVALDDDRSRAAGRARPIDDRPARDEQVGVLGHGRDVWAGVASVHPATITDHDQLPVGPA